MNSSLVIYTQDRFNRAPHFENINELLKTIDPKLPFLDFKTEFLKSLWEKEYPSLIEKLKNRNITKEEYIAGLPQIIERGLYQFWRMKH